MSEKHPRASLTSAVLPVLGFAVAVAAAVAVALLSPTSWLPQVWMNLAASVSVLVLAAWLAGRSARGLARTTLRRLASKTKTALDNQIVDGPVISRLAQALPWALIYFGIQAALQYPADASGEGVATGAETAPPDWIPLSVEIVKRSTLALVLVSLIRAISPLLDTVNNIYRTSYRDSARHSIKGYLQVVSILAYGAAVLAIVAVLAGTDPGAVFAGLGALMAVLLLVFRDTILSLVASVQIVSNDMVRIGDWVSMPQANTDGEVIDAALHTVKVQNWDKTISTIPTSKFITESFKNWRGMSESGGRRIKRALYVDMNSIFFLDSSAVERLSRYETIRDYMSSKVREIGEHNVGKGLPATGTVIHSADASPIPERRRLTNIGTFRAYVEHYLRNHPGVHQEMTLLTRQLPPGPKGVAIEIYCFSNDTAWAVYEGLQADIFDHLIAILPEFGLRLFQEPTGEDLASGIGASRAAKQS